jgi:hypothetical protein
MGGAHVNACPEQVLVDPHVDFVVLGEGERTLPELVRALEDNRPAAISGICGVGYKIRGKLVVPEHGDLIEDIDALPLPARDLIDPTRYTLGGKRLTMLITSRVRTVRFARSFSRQAANSAPALSVASSTRCDCAGRTLGQQSVTLKTTILASTRSALQLFWVLSVRSLVTRVSNSWP